MTAELERQGESDLSAALARFGLSRADGWTAHHLRTMNNTVWAVSRDGRGPEWALRRHRAGWRDRQSIAAELEVLALLAERQPASVRVPHPAPSSSADRLVQVEGDLYSLLSWIPGCPRRPGSGLVPADAWLLGRALGWIHTTTDELPDVIMPIDWTASTLFVDHPGLMGADPTLLHRRLGSSELALFDDIAARTAVVLGSAADWGLIHADFILGNCIWATEGGRTQLGVLDFDDFGRGARIFDLGAALGNLADFPDAWPQLGPQFLAGYRTAHDLPADAEEDLPVMMAARHTSLCLWAEGHRDRGDEWVATHVRARLEMARECLAVTF